MTKTKKSKAKAPVQAKAPEIAPSISAKTIAPEPVKAKPVTAPAPAAPVAKPAVPAPKAAAPVAKPAAPAPAQPKVRLEISKPGAKSVAIAGSFNSWQPEQAKSSGNGAWVKELNLGPGRYEYMLVVDGEWIADSNAKEFAPNPFGGQNSVLVIGA